MRFMVFFKDIKSLATFKTWISIFLAFTIPYNLAYSLFYVIWTYGLGFNHPLPFVGYLSLFPMFPAVFTTVWHQFPLEFRMNHVTRKRLVSYLLYMSVPAHTSRLPQPEFVHRPTRVGIQCQRSSRLACRLYEAAVNVVPQGVADASASVSRNGETQQCTIIFICTLG